MPIFISYSHNNSEFATNLATQLVQHKARVWIDEWELSVGDSIIARIQDAIEGASALLVILSQDSVKSEWCIKELNTGLIRELDERRVIVLPVLMEDCEIPLFLRDKKYADFTKDYDKGLQDVLSAISPISSDTLNRHEEDEMYLDWSIDYGSINGLFALEITMVEQAKNEPYTILTTVRVVGNEIATKYYHELKKVGLDWFHRFTVLTKISEVADDKNTQLLLNDETKKEAKIHIQADDIDIHWSVHIESRRLGKDTGKSILIRIGGQLNLVCTSLSTTLRQLTKQENDLLKQIQSQF